MIPARVSDKAKIAGAVRLPGSDEIPIALPRLLKAIHGQRADLDALYDLDDPTQRSSFIVWCLTAALEEYPSIRELMQRDLFPSLWEPVPGLSSGDTPIPISGLMLIVRLARADIQDAFQLPDDATEFAWWFILHGAQELELTALIPDHIKQAANASVIESQWSRTPPLTTVMARIWTTRPDLKETFDLRDPESRARFIRWFLVAGVRDYGLAWLLDHEQRSWLQAPFEEISTAAAAGISNYMAEVWRANATFTQRFDLASDAGADAFVTWWRSNGDASPGLATSLASGSGEAEAAEHVSGVDLFGYARGELGIGEDVRMLCQALDAHQIPHSVIDIRADPSIPQQDMSLEARLTDKPRHSAVVFAMTGLETARVVATRGFSESRGRYIIGNWPWELPKWPDQWAEAYDFVDEIWAPTRFIQDAFLADAPVPVLHMPYPVVLPAGYRRWRRSDFELPETRFLFHFSFDFLSYPHRKNPWACVEAFQRAFPPGDDGVGLVVKTMRAATNSTAWHRLRALASKDRRIVLINGTMSRDRTIGLMAVTDAYVSLHRSEGFGRGMAEAMLLERPVIATNFSGNTEFLTSETGFPVDYRLISVRAGQYPGGRGQRWADPDIDHAASMMRVVHGDPEAARTRAAAGRRFIETTYSPKTTGARYRSRLEALGLVNRRSGGR